MLALYIGFTLIPGTAEPVYDRTREGRKKEIVL